MEAVSGKCPTAAPAGGTKNANELDKEINGTCPICLDDLPPYWKGECPTINPCCGAVMCAKCDAGRNRACDNGARDGLASAAQLAGHCPCCRGRLPSTDAEAVKLLTSHSDKGKAWAQFRLSSVYLEGILSQRTDYAKGKQMLLLSAEQGHPDAQFILGKCHYLGELGIDKDVEAAKRWLRASAEQENPRAHNELAQIAEEEGDTDEYLRLLEISATIGYASAAGQLGLWYNAQVEKCEEEADAELLRDQAIHWFTVGAENGASELMFLAGHGTTMKIGHSLPADIPEFCRGIRWLRRARAAGDTNAEGWLEQLLPFARSACFGCNAEEQENGREFLRCVRCRSAWYCSKACQRNHWKKGHKQQCCKHDEE